MSSPFHDLGVLFTFGLWSGMPRLRRMGRCISCRSLHVEQVFCSAVGTIIGQKPLLQARTPCHCR